MTKPDNEIPLDQAQVLLSTFKKTYFGSVNKSLSMDENLSKVNVEEKIANIEQGRTYIFYLTEVTVVLACSNRGSFANPNL